jgi:hypothetical protein
MSKNKSENEIDSAYRLRQQMKIRNEWRRKSLEEQYLSELKLEPKPTLHLDPGGKRKSRARTDAVTYKNKRTEPKVARLGRILGMKHERKNGICHRSDARTNQARRTENPPTQHEVVAEPKLNPVLAACSERRKQTCRPRQLREENCCREEYVLHCLPEAKTED